MRELQISKTAVASVGVPPDLARDIWSDASLGSDFSTSHSDGHATTPREALLHGVPEFRPSDRPDTPRYMQVDEDSVLILPSKQVVEGAVDPARATLAGLPYGAHVGLLGRQRMQEYGIDRPEKLIQNMPRVEALGTVIGSTPAGTALLVAHTQTDRWSTITEAEADPTVPAAIREDAAAAARQFIDNGGELLAIVGHATLPGAREDDLDPVRLRRLGHTIHQNPQGALDAASVTMGLRVPNVDWQILTIPHNGRDGHVLRLGRTADGGFAGLNEAHSNSLRVITMGFLKTGHDSGRPVDDIIHRVGELAQRLSES